MILKQIEWFGKIVGAAVITGIVTFIIYLATKNGH
jgi:hypothetical protein